MEQATSLSPNLPPDAVRSSRRKFIRLAAITLGAAGLAGCATPTPVVKEVEVTRQVEVTRPVEVTRAVEVTRPVEVVKTVEVPKEIVKPIPPLPWKYVALDVETTRKLGHKGYYEGECCLGALSAILPQLVEKVGYPFDQFPAAVIRFGAGGMAGWSTTCGALVGSSVAISLVVDPKDVNTLVNELFGWYTQTAFPSDLSNQYGSTKQFLVAADKLKSDKVLAQSVSKSPLCHVSVTEWCKASQMASGSPERAERCARLTGDVAAHAVELLNAYFAGAFTASYKPSAEAQACTTCHTIGTNYAAGNFTRGKGECLSCHQPHELK